MRAVSRPLIPYVEERYDPRTNRGDYIRRGARDVADAMRQQGTLSAQMWSGIGQTVAGSLRDIAAHPELQRAAAREQMRLQREDQAYQRQEQQYQQQQAAAQQKQAAAERLRELMATEFKGQRIPSDRLVQEFGLEEAKEIDSVFDELFPEPKAPEPFTLNPGDVRFDGMGKQIASVPKPEPVEKPKTHVVTVPGPDGRPIAKVISEDEMRNGVPVYREPKAAQGPPEQTFVIRNGQVTPIAKGSAQPGDVPYSADAMQGMGGEASDARAMRTAAALNSIDVLKALAPKRIEGPAGIAQGAYESAQGALGYNTNAKQFNALLGPTAMQMAVAIQGAAGLSNSEREVMRNMLGTIHTMDYVSQMALLERASQLIRGGADVQQVTMNDPKTGEEVTRWVPARSRMPGSVPIGAGPDAVPAVVSAVPDLTGLKDGFKAIIREGPFAGQEWTMMNGVPKRLK